MAAPKGMRRGEVCSFATHNPGPSKRWKIDYICNEFNMLG
jgi:hypothetical protein